MSVRRWVLIAGVAFVACGLAAGIGTWRAAPALSAWATGLNAGLLAATFIAILWYSLKTHQLVDEQRATGAITNHPWLAAGYLQGRDITDSALAFGHEAYLPIVNVGRTPAFIQRVTVVLNVEDPSGCTVTPGGDNNPRVLVPADRVLVKVIHIEGLGTEANPTIYLEAVTEYGTADGGSGRITSRFRYADRRWKPRESDYTYTAAL